MVDEDVSKARLTSVLSMVRIRDFPSSPVP
ncbi:hypothetical protein J2747_002168 [Thermococcus stetteri]|nr:hypothetical protein [Thermococcus stetteri]